MPKVIPVPDALSKPFWDAVNEKRLILQHCAACDRLQYPPQPTCQFCGSADNLALITLDEDPRINFYSNLPGTPPYEVPVGAAVEVVFEEVAPGQLIHEWRVVN